MDHMTQPQPHGVGGIAPRADERNWAMAAHLAAFAAAYVALGLLAPLAVLLAKGDSSPFVRRHAVESLNFQITVLIWVVIGVAASILTLGVLLLVVVPLLIFVGLYYLVAVIVASVKASRGQEFRYPLTWRFVS